MASGSGRWRNDFPSKREYRRLYRKFLRILLKLNCCCDFTVSHGLDWEENPSPKRLEQLVEKCTGSQKDYLNILIDQERAMVILNGDNLYLSVYDPDLRLQATAAGAGCLRRALLLAAPTRLQCITKNSGTIEVVPEFSLCIRVISRWRR